MADEFSEKLNAILGNPEAMGQIMSLARALGGESGGPSAPPPQQEAPEPAAPPPSPPPEAQDVEFQPVEEPESPPQAQEAQAPDLSALLGMLGGGNLPDIDPRLIQLALRVWTEYSAQDNDKAALLGALKPFLKAERLEKMEKAEKIARLSRMVRVAIQLFKEEGEHV